MNFLCKKSHVIKHNFKTFCNFVAFLGKSNFMEAPQWYMPAFRQKYNFKGFNYVTFIKESN